MEAIEIMEDLFFIQRGYLNGNHFVYRSEEPILIDTAYVSDFDETERSLVALGVDPSRVRLIISTHGHCDHVGGNRIIQERSDCEIAMHKVGKHFMDTRDGWATWWSYYGQDAEFFHCSRPLEDGDLMRLGPHEFEVIYTPGHASDGIVLYNRRQRVLLSSDTLWENDLPVITERVEGTRAVFCVMESLARLEGLDVHTVYPGHGRPFKDMAKAVSSARRRVEGYMKDRKRIGNDLLKKIIVFTLMMKRGVEEDSSFKYLMTTRWYKETVDHYFNMRYEERYKRIMTDFLNRGIVKRKDGKIFTTVKP